MLYSKERFIILNVTSGIAKIQLIYLIFLYNLYVNDYNFTIEINIFGLCKDFFLISSVLYIIRNQCPLIVYFYTITLIVYKPVGLVKPSLVPLISVLLPHPTKIQRYSCFVFYYARIQPLVYFGLLRKIHALIYTSFYYKSLPKITSLLLFIPCRLYCIYIICCCSKNAM